MEKEINPTHKPYTSEINLTQQAINHLQKAAPWIKFISIMGFWGSGIIVLVALALFFFPFPFPGQFPIGLGLGSISFIYFVMAIITFIPCFYLYKYSNKLSKIKYTENGVATLEEAFFWQKRYWVFIGIIMIIYIGFIITVIAGVLIAAFALNAF